MVHLDIRPSWVKKLLWRAVDILVHFGLTHFQWHTVKNYYWIKTLHGNVVFMGHLWAKLSCEGDFWIHKIVNPKCWVCWSIATVNVNNHWYSLCYELNWTLFIVCNLSYVHAFPLVQRCSADTPGCVTLTCLINAQRRGSSGQVSIVGYVDEAYLKVSTVEYIPYSWMCVCLVSCTVHAYWYQDVQWMSHLSNTTLCRHNFPVPI